MLKSCKVLLGRVRNMITYVGSLWVCLKLMQISIKFGSETEKALITPKLVHFIMELELASS